MPALEFTLVDLMDRGLSVDPTVLNGHSKHIETPIAPVLDVSAVPQDELVDAVKVMANSAILRPELTIPGIVAPDFSKLFDGIGSARTPLQIATQFIAAKYQALKAASGFLGTPTTAVKACPDGKGYYRHFKGGSIYWHPSSGVHEVHGAIRTLWSKLGWERSFLGYPTSDEQQGRDPLSRGRYSHFQGGSIYWSPKTGAHEVHGAILVKYRMLGEEASFLGYPTTDERKTPDRRGRFNHFQAGSIYWTPQTGANEVHGLIRNYWASQGWERNDALGYPISDELIPDRRIGHVHPESRRKPLGKLPADVIKFPAEAIDVGFERIMTDAKPLSGLTSKDLPLLVDSPQLIDTPQLIEVKPELLNLGLGDRIRLPKDKYTLAKPRKSTAAENQSQNRFSDFENGVMFWKRGDRTATPLDPWEFSADGGKMFLTSAQVVAKYVPVARELAKRFGQMDYYRVQFVDTTGYRHDGAGVRNRQHRLNVLFRGKGSRRNRFVTVQLSVEAVFEAINRKVVGVITDWSLQSNTYGLVTTAQLHQVLDTELWNGLDLMPIDDTEAGKPLAILSVKTMPDGRINIFVEPND